MVAVIRKRGGNKSGVSVLNSDAVVSTRVATVGKVAALYTLFHRGVREDTVKRMQLCQLSWQFKIALIAWCICLKTT